MRREFDSIDDSAALIAQVEQAIADRTPLRIRGGDSKAFLGRTLDARTIDTRSHRGIVHYDPTELVVTARAGTPLTELEAALDEAGQMLPCEAPAFDGRATVGGMFAAALAGPRRPWAGAVRDFVLGCRIVTGQGRHLRFGGEVMKNVAGYDVSRLMAGSFGCLGLVTEVSLKVLPKPRAVRHLAFEVDAASARRRLTVWHRAGLPMTGACHANGVLHVRLEGGVGSVRAARETIGGQETPDAFWMRLRELRLPFFADPRPLWRLSLPVAAPLAALPGDALLDWGGAQRWLKSDAPPEALRRLAAELGGHATCFTPGVTDAPFQPLPDALLRVHRRLKARLDPHGIFNPGRLYADF
ncbi:MULTISPECIES: glycolate oxidase subunit GlcE [pseudomallei group]|uniref:FAD binding domain protein n=4 Tax=Burkholderia oklahomensis TaxID=342113 RepID=A0AAI8FR60_9BURK|nr:MULTISPECIES: glycolate oxidase subunit GlcE [pseudomallei group]AIO69904.1 FAD binding domain protein [Burkholderia oklahomensis]AOI40055.1 glycolate oxidase [Burkholderia oklahomensis EO147]AOI49723.1 glycolate oxidase [Burkholderia oklahomensis C6786]ARK46232.1 glycolate oxidase subunit GlcE [Burkholderia pseudomallei]ARK56222.1 glycolate oxidase subunit GlcE [Burkholderia pseudomallei]